MKPCRHAVELAPVCAPCLRTRASKAAWYAANRERHERMHQRWLRKNRRKRLAIDRAYRQRNLARRREADRLRHYGERGCNIIDDSLTLAVVFGLDDGICWICRGEVRPIDEDGDWHGKPTIDHVVAIKDGGTHDEGNVRLAHQACNVRRWNESRRQEEPADVPF